MKQILILPGQHVGAEITAAAHEVFLALEKKHNRSFSIQVLESSLLDSSIEKKLRGADAILTGPLTEKEKLKIPALFSPALHLSPVICYPSLIDRSPLKKEHIADGFDILFASPLDSPDTSLTLKEIVSQRDGSFVTTFSSKEGALRQITGGQIATQLLYNQRQFDVIYTSDILRETLSTLAAEIAGTPQLYANAWVSKKGSLSLFEATATMQKMRAGKGTANPVSALLAVCLMARHALDAPEIAEDLEGVIRALFAAGIRTGDLTQDDPFEANTQEMVTMILESL